MDISELCKSQMHCSLQIFQTTILLHFRQHWINISWQPIFLIIANLGQFALKYDELLGGEVIQVVQLGSLISYVLSPITQTVFHETTQATYVIQHTSLYFRAFSTQLHTNITRHMYFNSHSLLFLVLCRSITSNGCHILSHPLKLGDISNLTTSCNSGK